MIGSKLVFMCSGGSVTRQVTTATEVMILSSALRCRLSKSSHQALNLMYRRIAVSDASLIPGHFPAHRIGRKGVAGGWAEACDAYVYCMYVRRQKQVCAGANYLQRQTCMVSLCADNVKTLHCGGRPLDREKQYAKVNLAFIEVE